MWTYVDWIVTPNIGDVARTCATWTDRIITPCAVHGRAYGFMHLPYVCGLVYGKHVVLIRLLFFFQTNCDVDAYTALQLACTTHQHHGSTLPTHAPVNEAEIHVMLYQYI